MDRDGQVGVQSLLLAPTGISYHPKNSDLVISLPVEGNAGNSFSISVERGDTKLALKEGEIAVGHFGSGAYVIFRNDGKIESFGEGTHTGNMTIKGNLSVVGDTSVTGNTTLATTTASSVSATTALIGGINFASHVHRANLEGELTNVPE
jgi:hypothetical protein